jgi:CSLREA domain-containing protein
MNSRAGLLLRAKHRYYFRAVTLLLAAVMASLLLLLVGPGLPPAHAATTITVNSKDDPGSSGCDPTECTLREAIDAAAAATGDTINFSPTLNGSTIYLDSLYGTLDITNDLTIDGGNNAITISGNQSTGVFCVCAGAQLALKNLTVAEGEVVSDHGGGIYNGGMLEVTNSTFSGNSASGSGGFGGAIFNDNGATLMVTNSTFSGNSATDGGGIYNGGMLEVTNSTFSGNSASTQGGAILNASDWTLRNTILANSPSGGNCNSIGNPLIDGGYNIEFFPGNTCSFNASTSKSNTDPQFAGGLANNGGPTQTIALQPTSPAVDAIPPAGGCEVGITTDQRGVSRPQGAGCDIGAFELVPTPPTPPTPPQPPGPQPGPQPNPHHKHKHHHGHHGGHHHKHKGGGHGGNGGAGGGISRGGGQGIG